MDENQLKEIFKYIDLDAKQKEYAIKVIYKYIDDPVIKEFCSILGSLKNPIAHSFNILSEAGLKLQGKNIPVVLLCPDNMESLRVYPNLIIDGYHKNIGDLSAIFCKANLARFIKEYEADLADERRKEKWNGAERTTKHLNEYVDMPTARALTRYVFTDFELLDSEIRDLADAINLARKPLEIKYTESVTDWIEMYSTGPHSCMSPSGEIASKAPFDWKTMCPTSWFHFFPNTKGAYSMRNGKVLARTILYTKHIEKVTDDKGRTIWQPTKDAKWAYGRVFASNGEIEKKFTNSLVALDIQSLHDSFNPEKGVTWYIPGFAAKENNNIICPFPYFDNMSSSTLRVEYLKDTNEFKFEVSGKGSIPNSRGGHLKHSDYIILRCSNCGKVVKNDVCFETEHIDLIFCSDKCAFENDFVIVIDGGGRTMYKEHQDYYIKIRDSDVIHFSTLKAAQDNGFYPVMDESGIFPEECAIEVIRHKSDNTFVIQSKDGSNVVRIYDQWDRSVSAINIPRIPLGTFKHQKNVQYTDNESLFVDA